MADLESDLRVKEQELVQARTQAEAEKVVHLAIKWTRGLLYVCQSAYYLPLMFFVLLYHFFYFFLSILLSGEDY